MPQVIEILLIGVLLHVRSPFNREFISRAKSRGLSGRWDGVGKVWVFDAALQDAVVALCRSVYAGAEIRVPTAPAPAPRDPVAEARAWQGLDEVPRVAPARPAPAAVVPALAAAPATDAFLARVQEARARSRATRVAQREAPVVAPRIRDILFAGIGVAGVSSGKSTEWRGAGGLTRAQILDILATANLPADWAPEAKSAESQLGRVLGALNREGRAARKAKTPRPDRYTQRRDYRVRWIIQAGVDANVAIGEAAGRRLLAVELHDGGDALSFDAGSDPALQAEIERHYADLIAGEIYAAGDVTDWVAGVLRKHCGATQFGLGWYVPNSGLETAEALVGVISQRWGSNWISPLNEQVDGPSLFANLTRPFSDRISAVRRDLETQRAKARSENRAEVSPAIAAGLLRDLAEIDGDAAGYRALVGDAALAPAIAALRALSAELGTIATDSAQRFALLELDGEIRTETVPESVAIVERRLAPVAAPVVAERAAPVAAPVVEAPKAPAADPTSASWERFSNLELD